MINLPPPSLRLEKLRALREIIRQSDPENYSNEFWQHQIRTEISNIFSGEFENLCNALLLSTTSYRHLQKIVKFVTRQEELRNKNKHNHNHLQARTNLETARVLPESLEISEEIETDFFNKLYGLQAVLFQKNNANLSPYRQSIISNSCGFTSSVLTKYFKTISSARTVYGHFIEDEYVSYHYWTEVTADSGEIYTVDATYGQFEDSKEGSILIYPVSKLSEYRLSEFLTSSNPFFSCDLPTLNILKENNGELPDPDISGLSLKAYRDLISVFDNHNNIG